MTKASQFAWQLAQLQLAMVLGAVVCFLLLRLIPAGSRFALIYYPGAYLYTVGAYLFRHRRMVRGDPWRHGLQMAMAMRVRARLSAQPHSRQ